MPDQDPQVPPVPQDEPQVPDTGNGNPPPKKPPTIHAEGIGGA